MSRISSERLQEILEQPGYSLVHAPHPKCPLPHAESQRLARPTLERHPPGEKESVPRPLVRFTGYRVRPLDPDNFAGSVKDLLDGLRYAGLIPGDEPWRIRLETLQERVRHFSQEKTVIEIHT